MRSPILFLLGLSCTACIVPHDGTLAYFHNVYRQDSAPGTYDIMVRPHPEQQHPRLFQGKVGDILSEYCTSKAAAELDAVKTYLFVTFGEEELERAEQYTGNIKMRHLKSTRPHYEFGRSVQRGLEESQYVEFKSSRLPPPNAHLAPTNPHETQMLGKSITTHVAKYACAFLNGQHFVQAERQTSTLYFGIHDDGIVDGYQVDQEHRDRYEQQVHAQLKRLTRQSFYRSVEWVPVNNCLPMDAYVLMVKVTPMYNRKHVYALPHYTTKDNKDDLLFRFWLRKGVMCQLMTYTEIEEAFSQVNK